MNSLFYNLGKATNQRTKKLQWVWQSLTGSESDRIRAEEAVGEQLFRTQLAEAERIESQKLQTLEALLQQLSQRLRNRHRNFQVALIHEEQPNAWVLPGGFITMTTGLYHLTQGHCGELAFVLAHEMAHVVRGHALQRLLSNAAMKSALRLVRGGGLARSLLKQAGVQFIERSYSREQEFEADELAIKIMEAANFSRSSAVQLFERFCGANRGGSVAGRADFRVLEGWLATHPTPEDRIRRITSR